MSSLKLNGRNTARLGIPSLQVKIPSPVRYGDHWPSDSGDDGTLKGARRSQETNTTGNQRLNKATDQTECHEERETRPYPNPSGGRSSRLSHIRADTKAVKSLRTRHNRVRPDGTLEDPDSAIEQQATRSDNSEADHGEARAKMTGGEDESVDGEECSGDERSEGEDGGVTKTQEDDVQAYLEAETPAHNSTSRLARDILRVEDWRQKEFLKVQEDERNIASFTEDLKKREQNLEDQHGDVEKRRADVKQMRDNFKVREQLVRSLDSLLGQVRADNSDLV
jgi:hypothetical protein